MSSRRVFDSNNYITFNEYIQSLKGKEMFQNLKSIEDYKNTSNYKIVDKQITGFLDYDTFLLLTSAYFKAYGPIEKNIHIAPKSIMDSYTSYLCYNGFISHVESCNYCSTCNNDFNKITQCTTAKNILYPYGLMELKDCISKDYFNFPTKLVLPSHSYIKEDCNSKQLNNCGHIECYGNCNKIIPSSSSINLREINKIKPNYYNNYFETTCYVDKCLKKCECINNCCRGETCNTSRFNNLCCKRKKRMCENGKPLFLNKSCFK